MQADSFPPNDSLPQTQNSQNTAPERQSQEESVVQGTIVYHGRPLYHQNYQPPTQQAHRHPYLFSQAGPAKSYYDPIHHGPHTEYEGSERGRIMYNVDIQNSAKEIIEQEITLGTQILKFDKYFSGNSHWTYRNFWYIVTFLSALYLVPALLLAIWINAASGWLVFALTICTFAHGVSELYDLSRKNYSKNFIGYFVSLLYYTLSFICIIWLSIDIGAVTNKCPDHYYYYGWVISNPLGNYRGALIAKLACFTSIFFVSIGVTALDTILMRKVAKTRR